MSKENDGGPAFPEFERVVQYISGQSIEVPYPTAGMTLRDYFAAKALESGDCPHNANAHSACSSWAFDRADAMLEARDRL